MSVPEQPRSTAISRLTEGTGIVVLWLSGVVCAFVGFVLSLAGAAALDTDARTWGVVALVLGLVSLAVRLVWEFRTSPDGWSWAIIGLAAANLVVGAVGGVLWAS